MCSNFCFIIPFYYSTELLLQINTIGLELYKTGFCSGNGMCAW